MKEVRTAIPIHATPQKIWNVLLDTEKYPEWNPFITSVKGELAVGGRIHVRLEPPGGSAMSFHPTVLKLEPGKTFSWKGRLLLPGIFDGEHIFEIQDNRNGTCTFIHREIFSGILVPLLSGMLDNNTRRGFIIMNEKLKERCEAKLPL